MKGPSSWLRQPAPDLLGHPLGVTAGISFRGFFQGHDAHPACRLRRLVHASIRGPGHPFFFPGGKAVGIIPGGEPGTAFSTMPRRSVQRVRSPVRGQHPSRSSGEPLPSRHDWPLSSPTSGRLPRGGGTRPTSPGPTSSCRGHSRAGERRARPGGFLESRGDDGRIRSFHSRPGSVTGARPLSPGPRRLR